MSNIDQQFIEFVVKSLVGNPDAVRVDRRVDEKGVLLELTVDPEDLGRVIGKRGATAQSLRTLLRALGTKNDARYNLKIIDNGVGAQAGAPADDTAHEPVAAQPEPPKDDTKVVGPVEDDLDDEIETKTHQSSNSDQPNDRLAQTRQELADLDDLDV